MITVFTSQFLCFLLGSTYVLGLYMIPAEIKRRGYENAIHIRYRIAVTTFSNIITVAILAYSYNQLSNETALSNVSFLRAMGIRSDTAFVSVYRTLVLMCMFYLGPLTSYLLYSYKRCYFNINSVGIEQDAGDCASASAKGGGSLLNIFHIFFEDSRNSINLSLVFPETSARALIFAPISEEVIFRAGIIILLVCSSRGQDYQPWSVARWCPLWFGVAHLHHAYAQWKERTQGLDASSAHAAKRREIIKAIMTASCVQFAYTSVFGFIAALLFLRSGNLISPITSHVVCNWIQLPNVAFLVRPGASSASGSASASASAYSCLYEFRWFLVAVHLGGLLLFSYFLLPFSEMISLQGRGQGEARSGGEYGGDRLGSPLWR